MCVRENYTEHNYRSIIILIFVVVIIAVLALCQFEHIGDGDMVFWFHWYTIVYILYIHLPFCCCFHSMIRLWVGLIKFNVVLLLLLLLLLLILFCYVLLCCCYCFSVNFYFSHSLSLFHPATRPKQFFLSFHSCSFLYNFIVICFILLCTN